MATENKNFLEKINSSFSLFQWVWVKEKVVFYRLLYTMVDSWMSIVKWMWVLEKQEKNIAFKKILKRFWEELKSWKKLSDCLELYPNIFWEAEVWMVTSWEKTWRLNEVLKWLTEQIEKVDSITRKLKSALTYPWFIILVVLWVVFLMMTMVVPTLLEIFDDKASLPETTQALIFISDMFRDYWYLMITFFILFIIFVLVWKKTPTWKYIFSKIILSLPIVWDVAKKIILSKFSRVFAWLISSWVSIVESLKITSEAVWSEVYRQRIVLLSEDVKSGIKIWESIEWDELFPEMMIQMIKVWEDTAKLDETILKVADFYDEQVDTVIWMLNKLLEPIIIIFLALIVGFIALAIIEPIMDIADTVTWG